MKRCAWILRGAFATLVILTLFSGSDGGGGGGIVSPLHDAGGIRGDNACGWMLDVNTAGAEEFALLPEIGDALAARIVEYREENGPFSSVAELMDVPGIGQDTFQAIQDRIGVF